mgnify:CR=1 FL=1
MVLRTRRGVLDGAATRGRELPDVRPPRGEAEGAFHFFRLSKYQEPLLDYYRKHPSFIRPESRRNEVVAFVEGGLNDLSVSRTSLSWGIPVHDAPGPVFYVAYCALTHHTPVPGSPTPTPDSRPFWPAE